MTKIAIASRAAGFTTTSYKKAVKFLVKSAIYVVVAVVSMPSWHSSTPCPQHHLSRILLPALHSAYQLSSSTADFMTIVCNSLGCHETESNQVFTLYCWPIGPNGCMPNGSG
ncbi:hypothetical protein CI102_11829 [Trichoderma harzianum]|nr:hypothetical protein CI102_11829 [Trichoderma harzianum]